MHCAPPSRKRLFSPSVLAGVQRKGGVPTPSSPVESPQGTRWLGGPSGGNVCGLRDPESKRTFRAGREGGKPALQVGEGRGVWAWTPVGAAGGWASSPDPSSPALQRRPREKKGPQGMRVLGTLRPPSPCGHLHRPEQTPVHGAPGGMGTGFRSWKPILWRDAMTSSCCRSNGAAGRLSGPQPPHRQDPAGPDPSAAPSPLPNSLLGPAGFPALPGQAVTPSCHERGVRGPQTHC